MPGSVTITSGTWPDPVTSIEPTYWGLGSNVFAFLGTYHQHGEQQHSFESWLNEILQHPSAEILPGGRAPERLCRSLLPRRPRAANLRRARERRPLCVRRPL